ncbi:MAG TPA: SH3 domain-containing protein [Kofleriaceae bacterium]|nr:SH3 domain-containing protein [Kofleriaceae bacterium]
MKPVLIAITISITRAALAEPAPTEPSDPRPALVDPYGPQLQTRTVVHVASPTPVYAAPDTASQVVLVVQPAQTLYRRGASGAWTNVVTADGNIGWVPSSWLDAGHGEVPALDVDAKAQPTDETPHRPVDKRFVSGFRIGWMYLANIYKPLADRDGMSLAQKFGFKDPNMMLLGYEGFYRVVSHSWLDVIMVGNVSVAGLSQSVFIPSVNGLLGVEIERGFQIAAGVSLIPDPVAPSHAIFAAGWTPYIGSIQVPIHFIYIPDPDGNYRMAATLGLNW